MESIKQQFIALRKQFIESRFGKLNNMQRQAVFTTHGPLLILAGAGSGKTTVLVNRIANLILFGDAYNSTQVPSAILPEHIDELSACLRGESNPSTALTSMLSVNAVRPWNVLAITFTNKAAGELKNRLVSMMGEEMGSNINASTFHSACVRLLRREAEHIGFPKSFTIYDSDDQQRVIKEIYKNFSIDDKFLAPRACAGAIGRLKDKMLTPAEAAQNPADTKAQIVAQVYAAYAKRCKQAGAMDFDDLIYHTVRLLNENKEVRDYYQNRYRYVLVDEYQDTSVAQFQLVNLLCGPSANICVVGDDDQSIYRFRGATIENILSFEHRFQGAKVIRLEQNYRSTASILDAANSVIQNNSGRKGKTLWTDNHSGEKVQHFAAENEQEEASHIVEIIGRHLKDGAALKDHAVLYRMNAQSSPVENYFARSGIPYKIVGGLRFNDRKEIKDMHAYMCILVNPQDNLRLRRIINEPSRKIGVVTLDNIFSIAEELGVPMIDVIRDAHTFPVLSRAANALHNFYDVYKKILTAYEEMPLENFAAELPDITGYRSMLENQGSEGLTRLENIGQFVSNVKTYIDHNGLTGTLEGYLEEIALISDIDSYDEETDKVVMMTMHSAKGLEFPYVFIVGLEEGIFPSDMSKWSQEDVEEERRLCYVGITRARTQLYLSSAASRLLYGQTRRNPPSRFLKEINPEMLESETSPRVSAALVNNYIKYGTGGAGNANQGYLDKNYNRQPRAANSFANTVQPAAAGRSSIAASVGITATHGKKPPNLGVNFTVGDKVNHKAFGFGVVQKVTPVAGDSIVEINFDKNGVKKTMANFAPLKKV